MAKHILDLDKRISKREFLAAVAERVGLPHSKMAKIYKAMIDEITENAEAGKTVMLTGFGSFYPQQRKGHEVQFGKKGQRVDPYTVLKFSASSSYNRKLK